MKLVLLVYLASIVDNLNLASCLFGIFSIAAIGFSYVAIQWQRDFGKHQDVENAKSRAKRCSKPLFVTALICFILAILIPSERTIYLMAGAYATEQIASNNRVQKIGSDVLEVIENKLAELKGDKDGTK